LSKFKIKIELEKCLKLKVVQKRKVFKFQIFLKTEKKTIKQQKNRRKLEDTKEKWPKKEKPNEKTTETSTLAKWAWPNT
jgi:hypothetical protein